VALPDYLGLPSHTHWAGDTHNEPLRHPKSRTTRRERSSSARCGRYSLHGLTGWRQKN